MFDKVKQLGELKKMRDQAMQMQKALAEETIEVEESGVKIVMSGDQKVKEIEIEGEGQDRLVEVLNKAIKKSQEVAARKLQEMSGGLGGLLGQ
jgi:DNA-binding protein YbaB